MKSEMTSLRPSNPEDPESGPAPLPRIEAPRGSLWAGGGLIAALTVGTGALLYSYSQPAPKAVPPPAADSSAPGAPAAEAPLKAAAQLSMIAPDHAAKALSGSGFTPEQRAGILDAVKRGEMRLVAMPLLDTAGLAGQVVTVSTSGISQNVVLTGKFQRVVLPISKAGQVVIDPVSLPHAPALTIAAMTALGPELLPSLTALNQQIVLDVIVQ